MDTGMGTASFDGIAESLYRSAKLDPAEPCSPLRLATTLLGERCVRSVPPRALPGDACLARINSSWRIYLSSAATPERSRFAVCHELAHWALGIGSESDADEQVCDALAACLIAPRAAFAAALTRTGEAFRPLARSFVCTESCMALRVGEVTGKSLALVTPLNVRVRGTSWSWPPETELRRIAGARTSLPGIRRARLRDDPRRIVVRAG